MDLDGTSSVNVFGRSMNQGLVYINHALDKVRFHILEILYVLLFCGIITFG